MLYTQRAESSILSSVRNLPFVRSHLPSTHAPTFIYLLPLRSGDGHKPSCVHPGGWLPAPSLCARDGDSAGCAGAAQEDWGPLNAHQRLGGPLGWLALLYSWRDARDIAWDVDESRSSVAAPTTRARARNPTCILLGGMQEGRLATKAIEVNRVRWLKKERNRRLKSAQSFRIDLVLLCPHLYTPKCAPAAPPAAHSRRRAAASTNAGLDSSPRAQSKPIRAL